ncbi:MAG: PQQ-like beta-propeller repeat protein [Prolixibacteraceae bacterium]|nr:PQQ-like beta-propeller repeat protein [Prolixibacteraceae bacterium]
MKKLTFILPALLFIVVSCSVQPENESSQWRGPNRNGIYNESNLLKEWPENGPELLWSFEGLGYGHGSVAVANGKVYVTGIADTLNSQGTLFVFDQENGSLLWEKVYGPDWGVNFHGPRSTPTISGDYIYIESGMGKVYCLDKTNGNEIWSVDFKKDLGADTIQFGFSESVLVDGDNLICVPGGKENNVVALNRYTGNLVWSSPGVGEIATYSSPMNFIHNGQKMVVAMTSGSVMGFDANTGEMFWRVHQFQDNKIHANTPVYKDGKLLVCSASRRDSSGLVLFQLSDDGREVQVLWRDNRILNLMGGQIFMDGYIYTSNYQKKDWRVIDAANGEMILQNKDFGGGIVIYSDGLFYAYSEREGEIALFEASPENIRLISKFKIPLGDKEHWAHQVINNGILLVRHGNALMAYNLRES